MLYEVDDCVSLLMEMLSNDREFLNGCDRDNAMGNSSTKSLRRLIDRLVAATA